MKYKAALALLIIAALPAAAGEVLAESGAPPTSATAGIPGLPGLGGPFTLVDQNGAVRTDQEFRGKLLFVTFGFAQCSTVCPLQMQRLTQALALAGPEVAHQVVPLFITVDPDHDSPEELRHFISAFDPSIIGLTGSHEAIGSVARAYHVHAVETSQDDAGGSAISHSDMEYLMGRDGKFLTLIMPGASAADIAARLKKYTSQS